MRRFWRVLRWVLLGLIVLAGGVLLLNGFDDNLEPGAKAMLDAPVEAVPRQQNLYYALLGFSTTADDPERAGWDESQAFRDKLRTTPNILDLLQWKRPEHLALVGPRDELSRNGDLPGSLELLRKKPEVVERLLLDNRRLRDRYNGLYAYTRFVNPLPEGEIVIFEPDWQAVLNAKRLQMLELARDLAAGRTGDVVDWLVRDTAFWRRMLSETQLSMSDHFLITVALRQDFQMASQLVHAGYPDAEQMEALFRMAAPLTDAERNMSGVWETEFRKSARELFSGKDLAPPTSLRDWWDRFWYQLFYLHNATVNRMYRNALALREASSHACDRYAADRASLLDATSPATWITMRNPRGAVLTSISVPMELDYLSHTCDLQGFQRLLALQVLLQQRRLMDADIPAFVRTAGQGYADPYTDAPMQWLPEQRALSFGVRSKPLREVLPWPI